MICQHKILTYFCALILLFMDSCLNRSNNSLKEGLLIGIQEYEWILVILDDSYQFDSIPSGDIFGKKKLIFSHDSMFQYSFPGNKKIGVFKFDVIDSNRATLFSEERKPLFLDVKRGMDTIVLSYQSRHGIIKESYIPAHAINE